MAGSIVDPYGRPVRSSPGAYQFFEGSYERGQRERAWGYYNGAADWDKLLDIGEWTQLLSASRFLFANVPIVRGILMEQARFSFPLCAHYAGKDKEFGKEAEAWLYAWKQNNNVRGWPYNAHVNARIRMLARKVDGDICTVFVKRAGEFPKIQLIRAHRIGDPGPRWQDANGILKDGDYKGMRIRNGVVSDEYRRALAYCIPGEKPEETQFLPADSAFLTFNPEYSDQDRGVPEVVAAIRSYADLKRLRDYEMRAQQIYASLTVIEKNATGTADESSAAVLADTSGASTAGTPSGLNVEMYGEGIARYLKSGDGSGLEAFRGDRPSSDARAWEDKIVTAAIYSSGWDPNFALAIKEPGGAWARTILQKINAGINENVGIETRDQAREDYWALSWAVENKIIRAPSDGDLHSWNYEREAMPITADTGNDLAAQREAYKLGTTSLRIVASSQNQWWEELREQRDIEARDLLARARKIMQDFADLNLTFQECLQILEQRTPNANTPASSPEGPQEQKDQEKK
jgi:hypothetical protein